MTGDRGSGRSSVRSRCGARPASRRGLAGRDPQRLVVRSIGLSVRQEFGGCREQCRGSAVTGPIDTSEMAAGRPGGAPNADATREGRDRPSAADIRRHAARCGSHASHGIGVPRCLETSGPSEGSTSFAPGDLSVSSLGGDLRPVSASRRCTRAGDSFRSGIPSVAARPSCVTATRMRRSIARGSGCDHGTDETPGTGRIIGGRVVRNWQIKRIGAYSGMHVSGRRPASARAAPAADVRVIQSRTLGVAFEDTEPFAERPRRAKSGAVGRGPVPPTRAHRDRGHAGEPPQAGAGASDASSRQDVTPAARQIFSRAAAMHALPLQRAWRPGDCLARVRRARRPDGAPPIACGASRRSATGGAGHAQA
ncbi:hypothetical protein ROJ8625_03331 [Roseivivax jejudonensis]|uniref:Uncharacterized protein n=1 Tax=Roseivivax jejudonensis TaxID=1529041 RepID=A0A1X6ZYH4_9RHOB|nr:hypothetical protein ROJ8625_03331 [Roseivivax jejudonensis]